MTCLEDLLTLESRVLGAIVDRGAVMQGSQGYSATLDWLNYAAN